MLTQKKAVLLNGSPKAKDSVSAALGGYVLEKLQAKRWQVQSFRANLVIKSGLEELIGAINEADVVVITFPLYVDTLPAPLIGVLEQIGEYRRNHSADKVQRILTIANCGFPEAFHNNAALKICETFAKACGFQWVGGIAAGAGPALAGQSIKTQGMTQKIAKALDLASDAIISQRELAPEASQLMSSMMMPKRLYTFMGSLGWRRMAKKHQAHKRLYAKPYKKE